MVDMNSDHVLVVPDTPDRIQQSTCPAFSSVARRDVDPSPSRGFRFKTRNNSMHGPSSQADALCVLPAHIDADNIFKQADVARALAFPEGSEAKLASQKERKTTGTILLNERRGEKHVSDQSCSTSNNISSNDAGRRRRSYQISDEEVGQQDANHQNANFFGVESILPTIPVGEPQNRIGISIPNRLKAVADSDVCSGSRSEEVKDEMITNMIITGSSSPPSGVPQRHVGQKRLVRNGCISPSNVAKRSIRVDKRQEMISPSGVLHHQPPQRDVFGTANVIDLTDNSPAIKRHGNAVNISAKIVDTRATKRLRTDRAAEALVPASQYLANDSGCSGVSLSGRNNKGKETSHDMLDSNWIGEANSRSVCLSSAGTSAANNSSSCVNSEQGWRTTHNHTSKLPNSSMGKITNSSRQGSKSSAPFDLDHGSLEGNTSTSGATTIHTERFENRTIRIPRVRRKHALHSSHPGESSSALDGPNGSFLASSETTIGRISRYHTAHSHNIPVVTIDDVLPEVRPCSSGRTIGTSVDPTVQAQLESDELLARQLQEQLYNETPRVVPSEDDAVIAMSLQHEENAHRASRAVRRLQYNTRGAQRSRPNIFQNAVARTNNVISRLQNAGSVTLGLGAVSPRYSSAPHIQPNIDLNDYDALLALDENNHQHTGASETQINRLPQSVVQLNSIEEPCPVCLENPSVGDTIRHLPCFHKFHKECIDEWLRRKKLCPICKSGII